MEILTEEDDEMMTSSSIISDNTHFLLDENGFPSLSSPHPHPSFEAAAEEKKIDSDYVYDYNYDHEQEEEEEKDGSNIPVTNDNDDDDDDDETFASDFYSSGTDWSCLLLEDTKKTTSTSTSTSISNSKKNKGINSSSSSDKKLKQTDLFQLWGLKNNKNHQQQQSTTDTISSNSRVSSSLQLLPSNFDTGKKGLSMNGKASNDSVKKKKTFGNGNAARRRTCPFYKKIPGTPFTVDAFRYGLIEGCSAYFLSHFHYDHYGGLSKGWSHGPIYCTPLTARLVRLCLSVNPSFIRPLELDKEYVIEGIKVTLLEANHCPGAALIFFHLGDGRRLLHTGDFRACKLMQSHPLLVDKRVHLLYLDTTYCNQKYTFPPIEDVLSFVVKVTRDSLKKQPKTLVIVGAYSIGKERVYLAISEALGVKIYTNASRRRILQSFGWPELSGKLCSHAQDTPLHVLPISSLRHETLKQYLETNMHHYKSILAFRPTGWTYSGTSGSQLDLIKPSSRGNISIYGVPYSEHSSFLELREFVQFLRPEKIIPTVNIGNAAQRDKMQNYFREWLKA